MRVFCRNALGLSVALLALTACQTTEVDRVADLAPIEVAIGEELAPIQLDRVTFNLRRGTQIGTYRAVYLKCYPA